MTNQQNAQTDFDIAIVGGNIVGLALATSLNLSAQGQLKIAVLDSQSIEKLTDPDTDIRAFAISASSKQMLEAIGIWSKISPYANPITQIEITDSDLQDSVRPVLLSFENRLSNHEPSSYILQNSYIRNALIDNISNTNSIHLLNDVAVTDFKSSLYLQKIDTKTNTIKKTITAKLLIAADGKHSDLRHLAGIKTIGWDYDQHAIVTSVRHEISTEGKAIQHFLPSGPFAILPLKNNISSIVWSEKSETALKIMSYDETRFLEELKQRFTPLLGEIELAAKKATFPLNMKIARKFTSNRFALIGDSAHGVHPIAGLGLNIGLRDVAALTEVIIEKYRLGLDFADDLTLQKYERWRRFDSALSALTMDTMNRLFSNDLTLIKIVRDMGLGMVNNLPELKKFFVKQASGLSGTTPKLLKGELI